MNKTDTILLSKISIHSYNHSSRHRKNIFVVVVYKVLVQKKY